MYTILDKRFSDLNKLPFRQPGESRTGEKNDQMFPSFPEGHSGLSIRFEITKLLGSTSTNPRRVNPAFHRSEADKADLIQRLGKGWSNELDMGKVSHRGECGGV